MQFNNRIYIKPREARSSRFLEKKEKRTQSLSMARIEMAYRNQARKRIRRRKIAKIIEMYSNGHSIGDIGNDVGYRYPNISYILEKHFFPYRGDNPTVLVLQSKA